MRVSFVIPAFDEARTIEEVLDRVDALGLDRQIVVVDDGSTDGTAEIVERWRTARADAALVLLRQPNRGKGAAIRAAVPHADGEIVVIQDADMETGYKAMRMDVLRSLDLSQDDFAIEPEITAKVCRRKLRIYELPIAYYGRTYAEGKKITWRDGFKALWVLGRVRVRG